jgi:hypothetical protein
LEIAPTGQLASVPVSGSFRDPSGRVYICGDRIIRGVDQSTAEHFERLQKSTFFPAAMNNGSVVRTTLLHMHDPVAKPIRDEGWHAAIEHERLPVISYPYEWSFSMLKDAALLQLDLLSKAFKEGWTLKDATPYNVQFVGSRPVFIDTPSFVPRSSGEPWFGYRQFCMLNLYPLMLQAYKNIPFQGIVRANLDGITPIEARRYFGGWSQFFPSVFLHAGFPAIMERQVQKQGQTGRPMTKAGAPLQADRSIHNLIDSMHRVVSKLDAKPGSSVWSDYAQTHSYQDSDFSTKRKFVAQVAESLSPMTVWDIGSNTGEFSEICAKFADSVIAVDGDDSAIEALYRRLKRNATANILPLIMNLANMSPNQGWAGEERISLDRRSNPDLIVALALIHHIALSANIPIPLFLDWLAKRTPNLIIEFVDRDDEMTKALLANKKETYPLYNKDVFFAELQKRFQIRSSVKLKNGLREVYYCGRLRWLCSTGTHLSPLARDDSECWKDGSLSWKANSPHHLQRSPPTAPCIPIARANRLTWPTVDSSISAGERAHRRKSAETPVLASTSSRARSPQDSRGTARPALPCPGTVFE